MRLILLCLILIIVSGCGKNRHTIPWPANVLNIEGMSDEEKATVVKAIEDLNTEAGQTVVQLNTQEEANRFQITVVKVDPTAETATRAGFATYDSEKCKVELSSLLFSEKKTYLKAVVWHELGHCSGLEHSGTQGDLMYKTTSATSFYSKEAFSEFLKKLLASAGL